MKSLKRPHSPRALCTSRDRCPLPPRLPAAAAPGLSAPGAPPVQSRHLPLCWRLPASIPGCCLNWSPSLLHASSLNLPLCFRGKQCPDNGSAGRSWRVPPALLASHASHSSTAAPPLRPRLLVGTGACTLSFGLGGAAGPQPSLAASLQEDRALLGLVSALPSPTSTHTCSHCRAGSRASLSVPLSGFRLC